MEGKVKDQKQIVFFVDQQKFTVDEHQQFTVRQIIELAGENPAETTLVLKKGKDPVKLTGLDQIVELKDGAHFVIYHNGPTPVS